MADWMRAGRFHDALDEEKSRAGAGAASRRRRGKIEHPAAEARLGSEGVSRIGSPRRVSAKHQSMHHFILGDNHEVRERRDQLRHPRYAAPELLARPPIEYGAGTSLSCSGR
jgi:hypothetical protein